MKQVPCMFWSKRSVIACTHWLTCKTVFSKWPWSQKHEKQHTFACSRNDSTIRRSTRDGLIGSGGTGMLLALDTILPGFCRANSASVCCTNNPQNTMITTNYNYFINNITNNQSVTCIVAPLFVVKVASRRRRYESRNQLKATENRWDLRCLVNWDTDVAERIVSGREFQILGVVTQKARAAVVADVLGTTSKPASDERSRRLRV